MTILFCGGEDIDFVSSSGNSPSVRDAYYNSNLSRCSLQTPGGSEVIYNRSTFVSDGTNLWACVNYYGDYFITYGNWLFGLVNDSLSGIVVVWNSSNSKIELRKTDNTILATSDNTISILGNLNRFDLHIENLGATGTVSLYANGVLMANYTGDITPLSGYANITKMAFWSVYWAYCCFFSHVIIADEDIRIMSLKTLSPNAAGDTSTNWAGAYTDIDETTISDSDKIYSSTPDADFQCNVTGMPSGSWAVTAVKVAARCIDGSGTNGIAVGVKTNDTVSVSGAMSCSGYWQTKELLLNTNPVTGNPWTPAEIEALQFNLRCKAV